MKPNYRASRYVLDLLRTMDGLTLNIEVQGQEKNRVVRGHRQNIAKKRDVLGSSLPTRPGLACAHEFSKVYC